MASPAGSASSAAILIVSAPSLNHTREPRAQHEIAILTFPPLSIVLFSAIVIQWVTSRDNVASSGSHSETTNNNPHLSTTDGGTGGGTRGTRRTTFLQGRSTNYTTGTGDDDDFGSSATKGNKPGKSDIGTLLVDLDPASTAASQASQPSTADSRSASPSAASTFGDGKTTGVCSTTTVITAGDNHHPGGGRRVGATQVEAAEGPGGVTKYISVTVSSRAAAPGESAGLGAGGRGDRGSIEDAYHAHVRR